MAAFVEVTTMMALVLVFYRTILVFYPRSVTQRTDPGGWLKVHLLIVFGDVLVKRPSGLEIVRGAVIDAAFVGEFLLGSRTGEPMVDGGVVAVRTDLVLLLLDLRNLDGLHPLNLVIHVGAYITTLWNAQFSSQ